MQLTLSKRSSLPRWNLFKFT